VIVSERKEPVLLELGARGGGGHIFSTIVKECTGVNYPQELARILTGDVPRLQARRNAAAVYRFFNPSPGIIREIRIGDKILELPYVVDFGITARVGQQFVGLRDSMHRLGFVVTRGRDREEARANADRVEHMVEFIME
jgi:biotin carboxylase